METGTSCFHFLAADRLRRLPVACPTSPLKTRVRGFCARPSGRLSRRGRRTRTIATGCGGCGYKTASGRAKWISRDPSQEEGGLNLYSLVTNNPVNDSDILGLWGTDQHHAIIDKWLDDNAAPNDQDWKSFHWHCAVIDVDQLLKAGNDRIDGVGTTVGDFCDAQSSANSYQHAMRAYYQSVATAQALARVFCFDVHERRSARHRPGREWSCSWICGRGWSGK